MCLQLTGEQVEALLLLRISLHLAGEQVEFGWRCVRLRDKKQGERRVRPQRERTPASLNRTKTELRQVRYRINES